MKNERVAVVALYGVEVGFLIQRGSQTSFNFTQTYLELASRPVLGQYFEDNQRVLHRRAYGAPFWFANLLPESEAVRRSLRKELRLGSDSDFDILVATGADLPGAVTISELDRHVETTQMRVSEQDVDPEPQGGLRFSVAGVQMKLSVVLERNTIRLAGRGELGNYYVKIAGGLESVPRSEYLNLAIAGHVGLDVPEIELAEVTREWVPKQYLEMVGKPALLIKRFDRVASERVHIEDLNQVVHQSPSFKYHHLSQAGLVSLVHALGGEHDAWEAFRRTILNIAVGNEDAHLKNWSLIYRDARNARLSPLYDVVSTVAYPGFDRTFALRLGKSKNPVHYSTRTLTDLAKFAGLDPARAESETETLLSRIREVEEDLRSTAGLPREYWSALHAYRSKVPLLRGTWPESTTS